MREGGFQVVVGSFLNPSLVLFTLLTSSLEGYGKRVESGEFSRGRCASWAIEREIEEEVCFPGQSIREIRGIFKARAFVEMIYRCGEGRNSR